MDDDDSDAEFAEVTEFRSAPVLTGTASPGLACFDVDYDCPAPVAIDIVRDGSNIVHHWVQDRTHADEPFGLAPTHVCVGTDNITEATHNFELDVLCGSTWDSSLPLALVTEHNLLDLHVAQADEVFYGSGDTITLEFETSEAGLNLDVDFLPVDSSYSGNATIIDLGAGRYQAVHTLGSTNTRSSGDYQLPFTFRDPTGAPLENGKVRVRYLPGGPMKLFVSHGYYHPNPPPTPSTSSGATLVSVTDTNTFVAMPVVPDEHPDFSTPSTPPDYRDGRVYELEIATPGPAPVDHMRAIVTETGRAGHVTVPLTLTNVTCGLTQCTYDAELVIRSKHPSATEPQINGGIMIVAGTHTSQPGPFYKPAGAPDTESFLVRGTVKYDAPLIVQNCDTGTEDVEFMCNTLAPSNELPAARMLVKLKTGCGEIYQEWIDDEGYFEIPFSSICGGQPAQIRISSFAEPYPWPVAVFDRINGQKIWQTFAGLTQSYTNNPNDYSVYSEFLVFDQATMEDTFIPNVDAVWETPFEFEAVIQDEEEEDEVLAAAIHNARVGRKAMGYYASLFSPEDLDQFNVLIDLEEQVTGADEANYSNYMATIHPGFMHLHPNSRWAEFALAHETGHYFHEQFLRDGSGSYGRFSEPMSHIHAATILGTNWYVAFDNHRAENLDYNAKDEDGVIVQPQMIFYEDQNDPDIPNSPNCAIDPGHECCAGWVDNEQERHECMMSHSSGWDWRIFYDLSDLAEPVGGEPIENFSWGNYPGFDTIDGKMESMNPAEHEIIDVCLNYLGGSGGVPANANYVDRGMPMTDLVDTLDGAVCRGHIGANAEDLLHEVMAYDYDFMPINPTCN